MYGLWRGVLASGGGCGIGTLGALRTRVVERDEPVDVDRGDGVDRGRALGLGRRHVDLQVADLLVGGLDDTAHGLELRGGFGEPAFLDGDQQGDGLLAVCPGLGDPLQVGVAEALIGFDVARALWSSVRLLRRDRRHH